MATKTKPKKPGPGWSPVLQSPLDKMRQDAADRAAAIAKLKNRHVSAPAVPKLKNPTSHQRAAAKDIIVKGLKEQGVDVTNPVELRNLPAPARKQASRAVGYERTQQRKVAESVGRAWLASPEGRKALAKEGLTAKQVPRATLHSIGRQQTAAFAVQSRQLTERDKLIMASLGPPTTLLGKVAADAGALAQGTVVGGIVLGQGLVEAGLSGGKDTKTLQKLGKGVAEGFDKGALGELVLHGDVDAARQAFIDHPLFSALDFTAVGGVAGRVGGGFARALGSTAEAGGLRGGLARVGSRVRPAIALSDDPQAVVRGAFESRTHRPSLTGKLLERELDKTHAVMTDAHGKPVTVTDRGREVKVLRPRKVGPNSLEGRQKRQADFDVARGVATGSHGRSVQSRDSRVKGVRGKTERDVTSLVTEGVITSPEHIVADLRKHRDRIAGELEADRAIHAGESKGEPSYTTKKNVKRAESRVKLATAMLDKLEKDPNALRAAQRVVDEGTRHGKMLVELERRTAAVTGDNVDELDRARLKVAAVEHMGAVHHTVEMHQKLEREARKAESAAVAHAKTLPKGSPERARAEAHAQKLRTHRIEVSGRNTDQVRALEGQRETFRAVEAQRVFAKGAVDRLEARRTAAVELARSAKTRLDAAQRRGVRGLAQVKRERANLAKHKGRVEELDKKLLPAARAKLETAAARRDVEHGKLAALPRPKTTEGLRTSSGRHLSTDEIRKFLSDRGRDPDTVAYLPGEVRKGQFYQRAGQSRGTLTDGKTRTGKAHFYGTTETGADLLRAAGVRQQQILNRALTIDKMIHENGLRHAEWAGIVSKVEAADGDLSGLTRAERKIYDGDGYLTGKEADEMIRRLSDAGQEMVAMRAFPAKLDAETQHIIRDQLQGPGGIESLDQRLLNARFETDLSGNARNIVLVPAAYVERLERHMKPAGELERLGQVLNKPFRWAVLPQFRWLTGNFVEPFIVRLTIEGSGLNIFGMGADLRATRRFVKAGENHPDPAIRRAVEELKAQQLGSGLFVGGSEVRAVHRTLEDILPGSYARLVADMPHVEGLANIIGTSFHWLGTPFRAFFAGNRVIETTAQRAAFGRTLRRDAREMTGSMMKSMALGKDAIDDLLKGLTETPAQRRFMKEQEVMLGKYAGFDPITRRVVGSVMPFVPWMMNALRFMFWTMPSRHPILSAMLVKMNDAVAEDWKQEHANVPPGNLKFAVPNGKGGWIDVARYTPGGAITDPAGGGGFDTFVSQFLPQIRSGMEAISGRDPFGRPLTAAKTLDNPKGQVRGAGPIWAALNSLAGSLVPGYSTVQRLREGGGTSLSTSSPFSPKVKPDSKRVGAVEKWLNPLNPTYLRQTSEASGGLSPSELNGLKELSGVGSGLSDSERKALASGLSK